MAKKRSKSKSRIKPAVNTPTSTDHVNSEASATRPGSVLLNVCRLCETQDGPFLNIFNAEKNTAKVIENLMPFDINENDELPQKICFRCSAKVEEFNEFVQKCIKTFKNFCTALGKKCPAISKVKTHRLLWEEKLNKSNTTNEVICDAVIKKAMEGIALNFSAKEQALSLKNNSGPVKPVDKVEEKKSTIVSDVTGATIKSDIGKKSGVIKPAPNQEKSGLVKENINSEKCGPKSNKKSEDIPKKSADNPTTKRKLRSSRSNLPNENVTDDSEKLSQQSNVQPSVAHNLEKPIKNKQNMSEESSIVNKTPDQKSDNLSNTQNVELQTKKQEKPFNIMDHVYKIKVNGVGVLFQCQLCNRNFLKKDVVLSHGCAKSGIAKDSIKKNPIQPSEAPKVPTVKYITTKTYVDTSHLFQPQTKTTEIKQDSETVKSSNENKNSGAKTQITESRPKPKIGPASRVRKLDENVVTGSTSTKESGQNNVGHAHPVVQCTSAPSLGCQYKLLPGPNNTFTLVEAQSSEKTEEENKTVKAKKRRIAFEDEIEVDDNIKHDNSQSLDQMRKNLETSLKVKAGSSNTPYPVGLIKSVPRQTSTPGIIPFSATAEMKQSYAVVQTENPSKILILAKPEQSTPDSTRKRQKESKHKVKSDQPYSVTMEDATHPGDQGFFTFINVDPLLEPSYVLPTDNEFQEGLMPAHKARSAQKPYSCNMCNLKFTTEKKLLMHIHAHYNAKSDEEDLVNVDDMANKRSRRRQKK